MSGELAGRVAIVTGAGGTGVGRATARRLAAEGASVLLVDTRSSVGEVCEALLAEGARAAALVADVSREQDAARIAEHAVSAFGRIDVLVNNAASFLFRSLDATEAEWRKVLATNLIGPSLCAKYAVEHLRAARGAIVNVASISAFVAQRGMLTYNASKAGLVGLTRCLALDLAPDIRVNAIAPSLVYTGRLDADLRRAGSSRETMEAELEPGHLLRRSADPEEIASAIAFLASDRSSFVTGTCLMVDGGYTAI